MSEYSFLQGISDVPNNFERRDQSISESFIREFDQMLNLNTSNDRSSFIKSYNQTTGNILEENEFDN